MNRASPPPPHTPLGITLYITCGICGAADHFLALYLYVREMMYSLPLIYCQSVKKMLKKLMEKLDEDDIQMPDYALKSAGSGSCY